MFGSLYGAGVGAIGAGVGALVAPGERWADVPLQGVRLTILPVVGRQRGFVVVASF